MIAFGKYLQKVSSSDGFLICIDRKLKSHVSSNFTLILAIAIHCLQILLNKIIDSTNTAIVLLGSVYWD